MGNIIICFLIFSSIVVKAQNTFRLSIYLHNMNYYNTASGWDDIMRGEASLYFQHKWIDNDLFQNL